MTDEHDFTGMSGVPTNLPKRPRSTTVPLWLGVVSIVVGALGLLCWGGQATMFLGSAPVEGLPEQSEGHRLFEASGYLIATALSLWLIISAAAATGGANWARSLLRWWAIVRIVVAVIGIVGAYLWLDEIVRFSMAAMEQQIAEATSEGATPAETPTLTEPAIRAIISIWIVVSTAAVCAWPVVVLIVTRRRGDG